MPFFSIIMPVYNAAKYIEKAIQSVLAQSYHDFELIVIDDGSQDGSVQICQEYAQKDHRIYVLQMDKNSGASAARNKGIGKASGKYITFVDADDQITAEWLKKAHEELSSQEISCLKMGVIEEYVDQKDHVVYSRYCRPEGGNFKHPEEIKKEIVSMESIPVFGYLWNGFYLTSLIKEHQILINEDYRVNEDFDFNIRYFKYCRVLKCCGYCGYHYIKRLNHSLSSEQKHYSYVVQMTKIKSLLALYADIDSVPPAVRAQIFWIYTRFCFALLVRAADMNQYDRQWKEIKQAALYRDFLNTNFGRVSVKQKLLISCLKRGNDIVLYSVIHMIWAVKTKLPFLFAKVKK